MADDSKTFDGQVVLVMMSDLADFSRDEHRIYRKGWTLCWQ